MPADVKKLLAELKRGLKKLYGERLTRLYLYGSYARGDQREGSDLDVLVVLNDFERAPIELDRTDDLIGKLSLEYLITVSPIFMREKDWLNADKPLLRNVRVEGVPV
jgi:predicted nucleotidyltransferase